MNQKNNEYIKFVPPTHETYRAEIKNAQAKNPITFLNSEGFDSKAAERNLWLTAFNNSDNHLEKIDIQNKLIELSEQKKEELYRFFSSLFYGVENGKGAMKKDEVKEMLLLFKNDLADDFNDKDNIKSEDEHLVREFDTLWREHNGHWFDKDLYFYLYERKKDMQKRHEKLVTIKDECVEEFVGVFEEAVGKNVLPESVLTFMDDVRNLKVTLIDRLTAIGFKGNAGCTKNVSGIFYVFSELLLSENEMKLKSVIRHELLHLAAGKLQHGRVKYAENEDDVDSSSDNNNSKREVSKKGVYLIKNGLRLMNGARLARGDELTESKHFNVWMDEGVTEWLNLKLFGDKMDKIDGYKGSVAYEEERMELDRLFESGLNESLVINAYFENWDYTTGKDKKRGYYMSELIKEINAIDGDASFVRLNNKYLVKAVENLFVKHGFHRRESTEKMDGGIPTKGIIELTVHLGRSDAAKVQQSYVYFFGYKEQLGNEWHESSRETKNHRVAVAKSFLDDVKRTYSIVVDEFKVTN